MTIECFVLLLIMMNSTNGKSKDIQDFLKKIKESGEEDKFKDMLNKMPITKKVDNFLGTQDQMMAGTNPSYFGVPPEVREANKFMSGYTKGDFSDPEFIRNFKVIQEFNKKV